MTDKPECYKCKSSKYVRLITRYTDDRMSYNVWYCEKCRQDA